MILSVLWTLSAFSVTVSSRQSKFCISNVIAWCSKRNSRWSHTPSSESLRMSTVVSSCRSFTVPTWKSEPIIILGT